LIISEFESPRSISDLVTNAGAQAYEIIATLLLDELGMAGWTEKI
jgi:hypothetical protein